MKRCALVEKKLIPIAKSSKKKRRKKKKNQRKKKRKKKRKRIKNSNQNLNHVAIQKMTRKNLF